MNIFTLSRTKIRFVALIRTGIFLTLPFASHSQSFVGTSSNPADGGSVSTATVAVAPPAGVQAGDLVVVYAHYRNTGATLTMSSLSGQNWTTETASSGGTQTTRVFWCRFNGTWGANPSVAGGGSSLALSVVMYVYRPTNPLNSWIIDVAQVNTSETDNNVSITGAPTNSPKTVTMAFWASPAANTWGSLNGTGWTKTGLYDQVRNNAGSNQSHTAAYNIQATATTIADVEQTQTSSQSTRETIITWAELAPPSNDDCAGAVNLAVNSACSSIPGTLSAAHPSSIPLGGSCPGSLVADVWYKFQAVNNTATVTLGGVGAGITNPRIEVLTGTCAGFSTVACGSSSLTMAGTLTAGTTYYVRVYASGGFPPVANSNFTICITSSLLPTVRYGNSYVNISKKTTGGVVEPGDTLEIRMTINHTSGTMYYLRYVDNIPTKTTMLSGANDSIRVITNEGLTFRKYTPLAGDDAATYVASPPAGQYNIRLNLGFGVNPPGTPINNTSTSLNGAVGRMVAGSDRPRGGGGMLFATAYRVVVTGNVGDTITINPGRFIYKTGSLVTDPEVTLTATSFKMLISDPMDLCPNSIGVNNAAELGGTFGTGTTLNRPTDLTTPIPGYSFLNNVSAANGLGDGRYAIVKNISPRSSTNRTARRVPNCGTLPANDPDNCNNRMHNGHWDIDGDHTNTNNSTGNVPPDVTTPGGYMLMVNADYVASEVFSQTLNNLCPNTYYEFSAWFRNICPTCGMDSTGVQFTNPPTAPAAGYPGVYPNLSFALNGLDYYSTGEIDLVGWEKKGFVFRTGPTQTSATFSIRNNSQGGGGNDWVMDDIAVATCLPTMSYSPTINPNVCEANPITIADTVSSFFNNYTTYKWQRSTNGGASWGDITGVTSLPDTNYYITTYTVHPSQTTMADSGTLYRVVVATTASNLSDPNCNISDGVTITLHVLDCDPVLDVDILSFNGILQDGKARLSWRSANEDQPVRFVIERSDNGNDFSTVGELNGYNNGNSVNYYSFDDPAFVVDKVWYRIVMVNVKKKKKYTSTIRLFNNTPDFELSNLVNPFNSRLNFSIAVANNATVTTELFDMAGRKVLSGKQLVYAGTNSLTLTNTQSLPSGIYTLRISLKDKFITRRVVKN